MNVTKITIRSWPKMIFAWPTAVAALAAGMGTAMFPERAATIGLVFLCLFAGNMLVLSFEFCRTASLSFALASVAGGFGLILANQRWGFIEPLQVWFNARQWSAAPEFYYFFAAVHFALFVGMFIATRFDYWQLSQNELIHRRGFLGDFERYSTAGLKLNKEIHDVFEYLMAGAGRLVLNLPGAPAPIVLDNVLGIRRVERAADKLLDARVVRIERGDTRPHYGEAENG